MAGPANGRGRVQDRLVWTEAKLSRKTRWRRRKAAQRAAASSPRRSQDPCMEGLCFNCWRSGHRKRECTFQARCFRCREEGHMFKDCKRSGSEADEEELRRQALAKFARHVPLSPPRAPSPASSATPEEYREPMSFSTPRMEDASLLEAPICVVRRSPVIQDLERRLRFAMVAHVGGARPLVSRNQVVEAMLRVAGLPRDGFSVHTHRPEDFLIVLASAELRNRLEARPSVTFEGFTLFLKKWTRQAQASMESWRSRVHLVIEGVPPHAFDREVVEELVGTSCAITAVAQETASRQDLALFKVEAWTANVDRIPPARTLAIPEPVVEQVGTPSPAREFSDDSARTPVMPRELECDLLKYKVLIHVDRVDEPVDPKDHLFAPAPPSSGSEQSGLPSPPSWGGAGGRTSRRIPWQLGVPDRRGGTNIGSQGTACGGRRSYSQVAAAGHDWRLPPMETLLRDGPGSGDVSNLAEGQRPRGHVSATCRVRSIENKKFPTMGTMYQDLSTRYKQREDVYP
uniref:Uncharacterized protein n=1 Tax=Avena sativa TaxID=4498 RepID=A0ACD5TGY5_AVESA